MNNKCLKAILLAVVLVLLTSAFAQEKVEQQQSGTVEFGVRQVWGDVYGRPDIPFKLSLNSSKYNEYRSTPNGLFLHNFNLNIENFANTNLFVKMQGRDSLEKDQSYFASFGKYGKYQAIFQYDQTPHQFSNAARTIFAQPTPGRYTLSTPVRNSLIANPGANLLSTLNLFENRIDMALRRNTTTGKFVVTPSADFGAFLQISNEKQTGNRAIGAHMYASPSSETAELPEPIDYRTQTVKGLVDYGKQNWGFQVGYNGQYFENKVNVLEWDNPFQLVDDPSHTAMGRMDLYPDNQAHNVSFAGALDLGKKVRLMTSITPGWMSQNDAFVPGTANSAIAGMAAPDSIGLDGKKQTLAMNYTATMRPAKNLEFVARYRQYDYQNNTRQREIWTVQADSETFSAPGVVDHGPIQHETKPYSFFKKNVELSTTYTFTKNNSVKAGYEYEKVEREHRDVENSTENSFFAGLDLNPLKQIAFRLNYRHANREPELYEDETWPAQLPNTRRFDESARVRDKFDATLEVNPMDKLSFSGFYGTTQDNYDQPDVHNPVVYGLLKDIGYNYGFDMNYVWTPQVTMFGEYTREKYNTRMLSRQRNFPVTALNADIPLNDWASAQKDIVDTYSTGFDFLLNKGKVSISTFYSLSAAKGNVFNRRFATSGTGFLVTTISDFPQTSNRLHQVFAIARFKLPKGISPKIEYRFDQNDITDFQTNFTNISMFSKDSGASKMIWLGGDAPSYKAHNISAGVEYRF